MKKLNDFQFRGLVLNANGNLVELGQRVYLMEGNELVEGVIADAMYLMGGKYKPTHAQLKVQTCNGTTYTLFRSIYESNDKFHTKYGVDVFLYATIDDYFHGKPICWAMEYRTLTAKLPFVNFSADGNNLKAGAYYIDEKTLQVRYMDNVDCCVYYRVVLGDHGLQAVFSVSYDKFYATTDECADVLRNRVVVKTFVKPCREKKIVITIDIYNNTTDVVCK